MPTRNPKCEDLASLLWIDVVEEDQSSLRTQIGQLAGCDLTGKVAFPKTKVANFCGCRLFIPKEQVPQGDLDS